MGNVYEYVSMSVYEHMHICVHVYKGERVGPYLSHSFVTVTLCKRYI